MGEGEGVVERSRGRGTCGNSMLRRIRGKQSLHTEYMKRKIGTRSYPYPIGRGVGRRIPCHSKGHLRVNSSSNKG